MLSHRCRQDRAVTLVEILVVVGIVGILAALLFPVLSGAQKRTAMGQSMTRLRQTGMAILLYAQDHDGDLPTPWDQSTQTFWRSQLYSGGYLGASSEWQKVPGQTEPSFMNHPVLSCPMQQRLHPDAVRTDSFAMNEMIGYRPIPQSYHGPSRVAAFPEPSRTLLCANGPFKTGSKTFDLVIYPSQKPEAIDRGKTHALFVDGHVESIDVAAISTTANPLGSEASIFWRGR